ncbi:MAG: diguanylate cyclase [Vulcanimicrobiota bacterium]
MSGFHQDPVTLADDLAGYGLYITLGVGAYHLIAGLLSLKVEKALAALLIMADVGIGVMMTYLYGQPYFILVFTLPVIELAAFFGHLAAFFAAFLGLIFYAVIYAFPFLNMLENAQNPPYIKAQLHLSGVQGALSVLLIWLYALAVAEVGKRETMATEAKQQRDLLYQEIQSKTAEVGEIYGEVGQREARVIEMEAEIKSLREELEVSYRDLAESKMTLNRHESVMEETQNMLADELQREKAALERTGSRLKRTLEQKTRLLEIFQQIAASLSIDETLLALVFHLQSLFPSKTCVIFVLDEVDGHRQLFPEVADSPHTDYFRTLVLQVGEEAPGWAVASGRSLKIDNQVALVEGVEVRTLPGQGASALVAPLASQAVHGAIYLGREEPEAFSPEDLALLDEFVHMAGLAVGNALEFRQRINRGLNDPVTHLYNGLYLEERMKEEVRRGRRYTYPVSLILVDIDRFAGVAEQLGQEFAEGVLREIAEVLREATRETDVPARVEGDDFGVLLVHSDRNNAKVIGERIRSEVAGREFGVGRNRVRLTVSVGVAGVPHDATTDEHLRLRAHGALEQAQGMGGNQVSFYDG